MVTRLNHKIRRNITFSYIYKLLGMVLNYMLTPLLITYLSDEKYGIWITLMSIIAWFAYSDFGIGNGLRNKLTESISKNDIFATRSYIATSIVVIFFISIIIFLLFSVITIFTDFQKIFNTNNVSSNELKLMFFISVLFFAMNFVLSINKQIFYACNEASLVGLINVLPNLITIIGIFGTIKLYSNSLIAMAIINGISILLGNIIVTIVFFYKSKHLIPNFKYFDKNKINQILGIGVKFFIIQMCMIVIYSTDNMVITQILGPEYVTEYSIAFKIFQIITIFYGILLSVLWSAFTSAYYNKDFQWIKKTLKKLNILLGLVIFFTLIVGKYTNFIAQNWVGNNIKINESLIMAMMIYTFIYNVTNTYAIFLNGINRITIQMYCLLIGAIINIPLSIYLSKIYGSTGVIMGTSISLFFYLIAAPTETIWFIRKYLK